MFNVQRGGDISRVAKLREGIGPGWKNIGGDMSGVA